MRRRDFLAGMSEATALALLLPSGSALAQQVHHALDQGLRRLGSLDPRAIRRAKRRAAALVAKMTLAEKASQVGNTVPAIPRLKLPEYQYWSEALHGLARGFPGPSTSFPVPLALANTWNPALSESIYTAISDEARAYHNAKNTPLAFYSPQTLNTAKDPRWGRIDETLGEDPCLITHMVQATVRGMQGANPNYLKTVCCAKHFIGNETEDDRHVTSADIGPRSFWEYYTRPFRAAIDAGVYQVMSAYNSLNGVPCSADRFLLTELLRNRWGFEGYVTSDCDAVGDTYQTHHYVPTGEQAAALAVQAGVDLNCGDTMQKFLVSAVAKEMLSEKDIDRALTRLLSVRFLFGDFDSKAQTPWNRIPMSVVDGAAHRALALNAARQTLTLLKNENNTLPLNKSELKNVLVIGPLARRTNFGGYTGAPTVHVSPAEGIARMLGASLENPGRIQATDVVNVSWFYFLRPFVEPDNTLGNMLSGDNVTLPSQNFDGKTSIRVRVASALSGGSIEVRLDSSHGPLVATVPVPNTGGWDQWKVVEAPLHNASGNHPLNLSFQSTAPQPKQPPALTSLPHIVGNPLMKVDWLELLPLPQTQPASGGPKVTTMLGTTVLGPAVEAWFAQAEQAAREADVVIAIVGTDESVAHEQHDRKDITLPGAQTQLLQRLYAANKRTVAVLSSIAPLAVPWEARNLPAILCAYAAGQAQGQAIADALFGEHNPGGKLAETWYTGLEQLPSFHEYNIENNRTYMYFEGKPLFPFGHGLSYTEFTYSNLVLSSQTLGAGQTLRVSATVRNTGKRAGVEVAQLYVTAPQSPVKRPIRQLAGFARVELRPGQSRRVTFELPYAEPALWYWKEDERRFVLQPGALQIAVGASSADLRLHDKVQLHANTDPKLGGPETLHWNPVRIG